MTNEQAALFAAVQIERPGELPVTVWQLLKTADRVLEWLDGASDEQPRPEPPADASWLTFEKP